jgi:hypothetical protein
MVEPRTFGRLLVGLGTVIVVVVAVAIVLQHAAGRPAGVVSHQAGVSSPRAASPGASAQGSVPHRASAGPPVFAIYYMWWDRQHWITRLGPSYPATAQVSPLPAKLDGSGCGTVTNFPGNAVSDVSQHLSYDQDDPNTFLQDVRLAAKSGLAGFAVNWIGTGQADQAITSSRYNLRLHYMFDAVHRVNAAGIPFSLILNYQSSAKTLPVKQFSNDFRYFLSAYGRDPVLDHTYSRRPEVIMAGTWKYSDSDLRAISAQFRPTMYLLGDEKPSSWDATRASSLDGTSYYWSSQNPIKNKSSFATLARFADTVRQTPNPDGRPKTWLAPFTPGYNAMLLYNTPTCVPRDDGATMRQLFAGNTASKPDGWTLISWNEISEGSYVVPLTRYGTRYTDVLQQLIRTQR